MVSRDPSVFEKVRRGLSGLFNGAPPPPEPPGALNLQPRPQALRGLRDAAAGADPVVPDGAAAADARGERRRPREERGASEERDNDGGREERRRGRGRGEGKKKKKKRRRREPDAQERGVRRGGVPAFPVADEFPNDEDDPDSSDSSESASAAGDIDLPPSLATVLEDRSIRPEILNTYILWKDIESRAKESIDMPETTVIRPASNALKRASPLIRQGLASYDEMYLWLTAHDLMPGRVCSAVRSVLSTIARFRRNGRAFIPFWSLFTDSHAVVLARWITAQHLYDDQLRHQWAGRESGHQTLAQITRDALAYFCSCP